MNDEQTMATPASLPNIDDVPNLSGAQRDLTIAKFGTDAELYNKAFVVGDGLTIKILQALLEHKRNADTAESLIAAAADPEAPQPMAGGANNRAGMSRRDEVQEAQWHLATGASREEAAEWQIGEPYTGPARYWEIERDLRAAGLHDYKSELVKRWFAGDSVATGIVDRWHRIKTTSQPPPPMPRWGIAR